MPQVNKREQILRAGLYLVHRRGYTATSVATITDAAHAPKGSFYNHFPTKELFAVAVLDRYFDGVRDALLETVGDRSRPPLDRIRAYFTRLRDLGEPDAHGCGCLIGNLGAEAPPLSEAIRKQLETSLAEWRAGIGGAIAEAQRDGTARDDVPATVLAAILIDAWQGALLWAKVERGAAPLDAFLEVLLPTLLGADAP